MVKEHKWRLVDQHHDVSGMYAHASTALELLCQHPDLTDVVCATGTGATAAGLRNYLPASVNVHSRPANSGTVGRGGRSNLVGATSDDGAAAACDDERRAPVGAYLDGGVHGGSEHDAGSSLGPAHHDLPERLSDL